MRANARRDRGLAPSESDDRAWNRHLPAYPLFDFSEEFRMKHARKGFDRIQDPAGLIPADEPVFLLRAHDVFAASVVEYWADLLQNRGDRSSTAPEILMARIQAQRMRDWAREHGCKIPDVQPNTCVNCGHTFAEGTELRAHMADGNCEW